MNRVDENMEVDACGLIGDGLDGRTALALVTGEVTLCLDLGIPCTRAARLTIESLRCVYCMRMRTFLQSRADEGISEDARTCCPWYGPRYLGSDSWC